MNILLITTHLNIGGIARYTINLAKALKTKGENVYIASSGGILKESLQQFGLLHIDMDINTKCELHPKLIKAIRSLRNFINHNKIDVIHAQTRVSQMVGFFLSKLTGIPYVSTCHGFFGNKLSRKLFGLWGQKVIAISDPVREYLVNALNVKKTNVEVIYNGIDLPYFNKRFSDAELSEVKETIGLKDRIIVGTIARLSPVKGIEYLIDAARLLVRENQKIGFVIIGNGPHQHVLKERVASYQLGENVKFIDEVLDTRPYLHSIDIFVLTSLQEGLGLSLIEAMAAGKPVIATNVGGVCTLIKHERTGILIPPRNPEALKSSILRLLAEKEFSKTLSRNAQDFISKNFSLEDMATKTLSFYREVILTHEV
ncbi:MAG: glycosyltransferase family 4 protein [Candidatus Omnitrophota bacterium]